MDEKKSAVTVPYICIVFILILYAIFMPVDAAWIAVVIIGSGLLLVLPDVLKYKG